MDTYHVEYVKSEQITNASQLKEIFRDHCGIEIDGRIYISIESILDVHYLCARYAFEMETICDDDEYLDPDADNSVKTCEFVRIGNMVYDIWFNK